VHDTFLDIIKQDKSSKIKVVFSMGADILDLNTSKFGRVVAD
jgi:hypothetical protein